MRVCSKDIIIKRMKLAEKLLRSTGSHDIQVMDDLRFARLHIRHVVQKVKGKK